jgi:predicted glycosyltransferase
LKLFLDIGHPAHVHYFRHFIKIMESRGHRFYITARQREHVGELLEAYDIPFTNRGKGGTTIVGKLLYLIKTVFQQYFRALGFRPDIFIDFSTIYSGPAAWLLRKPYLTFTDTENTRLYRRLIQPFCSAVYTPLCFKDNLGSTHVRFNGLMEMASISCFNPNPQVYNLLGLEAGAPFAMVRFVDWKALHDRGKKGFSDAQKVILVQRLAAHGQVLISSEGPLPESLERYRVTLPAHMIYDVLFYASVFVGESATMASEAALLGTPSLFVSDFQLGYLQYLEKTGGLVHNFGSSLNEQQAAISMSETLMLRPHDREKNREEAQAFLNRHIDVTQFMVDVAEEWGVGGKNERL